MVKFGCFARGKSVGVGWGPANGGPTSQSAYESKRIVRKARVCRSLSAPGYECWNINTTLWKAMFPEPLVTLNVAVFAPTLMCALLVLCGFTSKGTQ